MRETITFCKNSVNFLLSMSTRVSYNMENLMILDRLETGPGGAFRKNFRKQKTSLYIWKILPTEMYSSERLKQNFCFAGSLFCLRGSLDFESKEEASSTTILKEVGGKVKKASLKGWRIGWEKWYRQAETVIRHAI